MLVVGVGKPTPAILFKKGIEVVMTTQIEAGVAERTFINVKEPNTSFQIKEGRPELNQPIRQADGTVIYPPRVGDKYVTFVDALFSTTDEECIKWCEERYPDVLDMDAPETMSLARLSSMSVPRDYYEPDTKQDLAGMASNDIREAIKHGVAKKLREMGIDENGGGSGSSDGGDGGDGGNSGTSVNSNKGSGSLLPR